MPFGMCSAAEILQRNVYRVFGDIKDTYAIADDILIATEDEKSHDEVLRTVIQRARDNKVQQEEDPAEEATSCVLRGTHRRRGFET